MELILITQGILLMLLVLRVVYLGKKVEEMLKFQEDVMDFNTAQTHLNASQSDINALFADEIDRIYEIIKVIKE